MMLVTDAHEPSRRSARIPLLPGLEVVGAIAMISVADSLTSPVVAWLFVIGSVALFADGVSRAIPRHWGGMREYKQ
jgi:hypothetical protein